MSWFGRHPGMRRLLPFADGEASESEAREIQEHLSGCPRCQRELGFLHEVRRAAREMAHPSPPKGMLEEILRRRAEGERVILPRAAPPPRRSTPGTLGVVLLAVLLGALALAGALLLGTGEARAGASSLRIGPERPRLGQPLEVEFRAASRLAAEERVVLRGRYRSAGAGPVRPGGPLGDPISLELERTGTGAYSDTAWLPPGAVYAAFVVESPDGTRLESDAGRPWEVLAHDETGRPLLAALAQRFRVLEAMGRPDAALATAVRMTELYPDEPRAWSLRLGSELRAAAPAEADSLREAHRVRLQRLERTVSRMPDPGGERLAALLEYARRLGEKESARGWEDRLLEEHPRHPAAQRSRLLSIVAASRGPSGESGEGLRVFDLEWDRAGAMDRSLLRIAFALAVESGDSAAVRRWAERWRRYHPQDAEVIAVRLSGMPEHRALGIEMLREVVARLGTPPPEERPLLLSRAEHERRLERRRGRLLAALGEALLAEGRPTAALETLSRAARHGWDPELFVELARLRMVAGDRAGGLALFGRAAADPLAGPSVREKAEAAAGGRLSEETWARAVERGRAELDRRIAAEPTRWPARGEPIRVHDADGAEVRLDPLLQGRVGLLAFWIADLHETGRLAELAPRLEGAGTRAIALWTGEPPPDGRTGAFASLRDARREASEAFAAWARPWYVVVDGKGLLRYEGRSLEDAARRALVLAAARAGSP